ncbi:MAG: SDR family oxidoreductase [Actinomycetota bacterium]|nr:SDR family oxidoreductase [Actinomycetota bacterium]
MGIFDLTESLVLVTGSTRGIGRTIATGLLAAGASVVINGRDVATVSQAAGEIRAEMPAAHVCEAPFDVTDQAAVVSAVRAIEREYGPLDGLVNNAGVQHRVPLLELDLDDWDRVLRTDLTSAFLVGREVARGMVTRGRGSILNVCSIQSDLARPSIAPYTAAKGGLRNLTRAMTAEWAGSGVRINGIAPGYLRTEMTKALIEDPEFDHWVRGRTPAGRWGDPEDLIGAAVFFLSDASRFVTGQLLFIDGGMSVVV